MLKYGSVCSVLLALLIFFLVLEEITHLVLCVLSVFFSHFPFCIFSREGQELCVQHIIRSLL